MNSLYRRLLNYYQLKNKQPNRIALAHIVDGIIPRPKLKNLSVSIPHNTESKPLHQFVSHQRNLVLTSSPKTPIHQPAEFSNIFLELGKQLMKVEPDFPYGMLMLTFTLLLSTWLFIAIYVLG